MNDTQKTAIINSAASLQEAAEKLGRTPSAVSSLSARLRKAGHDVKKFTPEKGGARDGAGRPTRRFKFDDHVIIERGQINALPSPPEMWRVVGVEGGYFELERVVDGTSEIITISNATSWNE